ncbi:major facilitator superfamily domain-containing protein [Corynascus novoguineensis]|uniref:Major facilitator superfamily domain-containing protein n=1 Tax=Corynascus novoguineensis TaxID=1126955 RepID=A0AAN7CJX6_9PEZI|nr:major facilitator superfamily domain-containing protein [Corynascus novoguineensis]
MYIASLLNMYMYINPDIVDWDGPNDPAYPRNWPRGKKRTHVALLSTFTFCANMLTTIFAPGAGSLAKEFGITSPIIVSLTVSIYGRRNIYHISNAVYLGAVAGCAWSTDVAMFMAPMTIGRGSIADMFKDEERGSAMAAWSIGPMLGPCAGPVIGGFVTSTIGWRWTFYLLLILAGVSHTIALFLTKETFEPVLLERKTALLRKSTGNPNLCARTSGSDHLPLHSLLRSIIRPTKILFLSPIVALLSTYTAFVFGLIYLLFTTFPQVFGETYHFDFGIGGLVYLGTDGAKTRPETRLIMMVFVAPLLPVGFFWYGWSVRSLFGALLPLAGPPIYSRLGFGWGNSLLAFIGLLFVPIPWLFYRGRQALREKYVVRL